ncbi:MAG: hypothetical protein SFW62_09840 [Alphaproteobacteria bacterium]|nr:hypothetical protein [Alphaproteobacteria bacterium]
MRENAVFSRLLKNLRAGLFVLLATLFCSQAVAVDLPLAAGSPLVGFAFDDRPLLLTVHRNFQMAMLTAGSEIGRSCGKMESYGWRMDQSEQQRVNQIFNNTVDRLRALGYVVETQAPSSISRDITMFTADRPDKHFLFMWSAGEIGLVMVLCESSAPAPSRLAPQRQSMGQPQDVLQSNLAIPVQEKTRKIMESHFSPVGEWVGNYTCAQGYTGATLRIDRLKDEDFEGVFRFYPTPKNPNVSKGSYTVYGQYDRESQRILVNPGRWLEQPKGQYNTIIVGNFNPVDRTFSGYFQGIMGCTSIEAKYMGASKEIKAAKPKAKKPVKKKSAAKKSVPKKEEAPAVTPAVQATEPAATTSAPAASEPVVATPTIPAPTPPAAVEPSVPPKAETPPAAAAPTVPTMPLLPEPVTPPAEPKKEVPKPTSSLDLNNKIVVASGGSGCCYNTRAPAAPAARYFTPTVPVAPAARYVTPTVPQWRQAPAAAQASYRSPYLPPAPPPNYVAPEVPQWPQAPQAPGPSYYSPYVPQVPQAPQAPGPDYITYPNCLS